MSRVIHRALTGGLVLIVGLSLGLAACARPQGGPTSPADPADSASLASPSNPPSATPSARPPVILPSGKESAHVERTQSSGEVTIRGVIQDGVEAGCYLIRVDGGGLYLLLGGDVSTIQAGRRVEVVGVPKPLLVTTCQQGTPLQVTSIRAI